MFRSQEYGRLPDMSDVELHIEVRDSRCCKETMEGQAIRKTVEVEAVRKVEQVEAGLLVILT